MTNTMKHLKVLENKLNSYKNTKSQDKPEENDGMYML